MICQHCGKTPANRPRSLCWTCYHRPDIRALYPSRSKFGLWSDLPAASEKTLPEPTLAAPGSAEKIAVMAERARHRQQLFHPADLTFASE